MPSTRKLEQLLLRLCKAQEQQVVATTLQAQAIDRLAASNEEIIDLLTQERDEAEQSDEPRFDLAGRPLDS